MYIYIYIYIQRERERERLFRYVCISTSAARQGAARRGCRAVAPPTMNELGITRSEPACVGPPRCSARYVRVPIIPCLFRLHVRKPTVSKLAVLR